MNRAYRSYWRWTLLAVLLAIPNLAPVAAQDNNTAGQTARWEPCSERDGWKKLVPGCGAGGRRPGPAEPPLPWFRGQTYTSHYIAFGGAVKVETPVHIVRNPMALNEALANLIEIALRDTERSSPFWRIGVEQAGGNGPVVIGDPVVASNGEFIDTTLDLDLGGPLPLGFGRYYGAFVGVVASAQGFYGFFDSPMGAYWAHNYLILLRRIDAQNVSIYYHRGLALFFRKSESGWSLVQPAPNYRGVPYQLVEEGTKLKLMDPVVSRILSFETSGMGIGTVRGAETIRDRNGNTHTLSHNPDGTLARVVDGLGRSLEFTYQISSARPRIVRVADQTGRAITFAYDRPLLVSHTDPLGRTHRYTHFGNTALLETMTRPLGNLVLRNTFDLSNGRILTQADALGNVTRFAYGGGNTTVTDPLNNREVYGFNGQLRLISFTDADGAQILHEYDDSHRRTATVDRLGQRSSLTYHTPSGKVATRTDAEGNVWRYHYVEQMQEGFSFYNLARIERPDGSSEDFAYDERGNLITRRDANGQFWNWSYNGRGQVTGASNPAGGVTTWTYNNDGTTSSVRDAADNLTTYGYDTLKRLTRVVQADGTNRQMEYDLRDQLVRVTDEKGSATRFGYDDNGNLTTATDPAGQRSTFSYDPADRLVQVTDPLGGVWRRTYDAAGRVVSDVDALGNSLDYGYDARGRLVSTTDAEGNRWSYGYDQEAVPSSVTDPLGKTWQFASDRLGRIRAVTDPLSFTRRLDYDALGRLVSGVDALGQAATWGHDPRGHLNRATLPGGTEATYGRNELGLLTRITDPRGHNSTRTWDSLGRLQSMTDAAGHVIRVTAYDARNRLTQLEMPSGTLEVVYDPVGQPASLRYSDGLRLDFIYDELSRLTGGNGLTVAYDATGRTTASNGITAARDAAGRITQMRLAPGKTITYEYDRTGRLTAVTDWAGTVTRFVYDAAGRLLRITRPNGVETLYRRDDAGRLTGITENRDDRTLSALALTLDARGHVIQAERNTPLEPDLIQGGRNFDLDAANQITTHSYDGLGRRTRGDGRSYSWDLASRLISSTEGQTAVRFTHDALGNLLTRTQGGRTREFVWNYLLALPSVSLLREEGITARYYIHTPGGLLLYSIEETDARRRYYHFEETGSTLFLTDDDGKITDSYAYSPYGRMTGATGVTDNPFTYVGQLGVLREPGTGLYVMRVRIYDGETGRFLSRDPLGEDPWDVRSLEPYHYAAQNPLSFVDPTGLRSTFNFVVTDPSGIQFAWPFQIDSQSRADTRPVRITNIRGGRAGSLPETNGSSNFPVRLTFSPGWINQRDAFRGNYLGSLGQVAPSLAEILFPER